jgi:predicted phosphodiesterase
MRFLCVSDVHGHAAALRAVIGARHALGELIVARLGKLAQTARLPLPNGEELVVVHGSPADPTEPFTADMTDEELYALVGDDPGDYIVCGGSHVPFHRKLEQVHIINVGSVGEAPQTGTAHGTLIDAGPFGVTLEQFEVEL